MKMKPDPTVAKPNAKNKKKKPIHISPQLDSIKMEIKPKPFAATQKKWSRTPNPLLLTLMANNVHEA